jgi:DNA-binding transcriptional ArsR family regulator
MTAGPPVRTLWADAVLAAVAAGTLDPAVCAVALALWSHMNPAGSCWPSKARLAEVTRQSPSTVKRHLRALTGAGLLTAHRDRPGPLPNHYQAELMGSPVTPSDGVTHDPKQVFLGSPMTPDGVTHDPFMGSPMTPEPVHEPVHEPAAAVASRARKSRRGRPGVVDNPGQRPLWPTPAVVAEPVAEPVPVAAVAPAPVAEARAQLTAARKRGGNAKPRQPCECGHGVSQHAEPIRGRLPSCNAEGCGCECFTRAPRAKRAFGATG